MDTTTQGVSKRDQDLEAIRKNREAETVQVEPAVKEIAETPEVIPVKMMQFYDEDGKVYEIPATAHAKLKIDGEEIETPIETMSRRYQKGAAGDRRLLEANQVKQRLEQKERELTKKEQDFLNRMTKEKETPPSDDSLDDIRALAEAITDAEEDKVAELLPRILKGKEVKPAPPVDIDKLVEQKLTQRDWQNSRKQAQDRFYTDYSDIAEDPDLVDMVDKKTIHIARENPTMTPWEIIKTAADSVKTWRDKVVKNNQPKRKKVSVPTPASGRASIGTDPAPPQTRKERLNEIRKSRGQPPL